MRTERKMRKTKINLAGLMVAAGASGLFGLGQRAHADEGGVPLHGFADVNYMTSGSNSPDDQRLSGFNLGNIDFFLTPELGHNVKSLFELIFETDPYTGAVAPDLERGQLGYVINDNNTFWVGRFHTPYGVWNTSYHHGKELMPTIVRPRFIDFEDAGGNLPAHAVGAWLHGSMDHGPDKIKYDFFVGNGSRIVPNSGGTGGILDFNLLKTDHPNAQIGFNLGYQFRSGKAEGLIVGLHAYQQQINAYSSSSYAGSSTPTMQVGQQMYGAYAFFENDRWSGDFELYLISNNNRAPGTSDNHQANLFFVEADYQLKDQWRPYVMFEKASMDSSDPYYAALVDSSAYTRTSLGVRYDISAEACVKAGWSGTNQQSSPGLALGSIGYGTTYYDRWQLQYAIRF